MLTKGHTILDLDEDIELYCDEAGPVNIFIEKIFWLPE